MTQMKWLAFFLSQKKDKYKIFEVNFNNIKLFHWNETHEIKQSN